MAPPFVRPLALLTLAGSAWSSLDVEVLDRRQSTLVVPAVLPGTWSYQGCYTDPGPRTLDAISYSSTNNMTNEYCIGFCTQNNYIYAGTEYSQQCYCSNQIASTGAVATSTDCNMACSGNTTQACGGPNRLTLFWNGKNPPAGPSTNPGVNSWGFYGCYSEGTGGRALTTGPVTNIPGGSSNLTVANCVAACNSLGFTMAGVEYADECYCDNALQYNSTIAPGGISDCNMLCAGNSTEYCGAGNRLDVYQKNYVGSQSTVAPVVVSSTATLSTSSSSSTKASTTSTSSSSSSSTSSKSSSSSTSTKSSSSSTSTQSSTSTSSTKSSTSSTSTKPSSSSSTTKSSSSSSSTSKTSSSSTSSTGSSTSSSSTKTTSSSTSSKSSSTTQSSSSSTSSSTSSSSKSSTVSSSSSVSSTSSSTSSAPTGPQTVPAVANYIYFGCYTEATNVRALTPGAFAADTMTVESCEASCAGYTYFGVEYGRECYCGNTINAGSIAANPGDCNMLCAGNSLEYCGAGNRLNMYAKNGTAVPTTSSSSSTSMSTSMSTSTSKTATGAASSTSSSQTSSATGLPAGWSYAGCYTEGTNGRALLNQQAGGNTNTVENCIATCVSAGYTVAGLEYSSQCFCDTALHNGAAQTSASSCNMACSGNANEMCGAGDILSIYNTGNLTVYQAPAAQKTGLPGNWTYQGCYSDNVNQNRALFWQSYLTNNNSATACLNLCAQYGYMAAGTEYGDECYCGDDSALVASGSTIQPETDCQVSCSGDPNHYCGGGSRLSYYKWTGTPLYTWNQPSGTAMGSYQYLVGGVVVPLITTTGINNKIVFMEKSGTGAPNTTGTYELDLTFINTNLTAAWRPLHVKSDIFCSAGITLPDLAGRQLNIGGWAGASTYGVRLYWPTGSPGTLGTSDWQENVNEVSLLAGRWYPSAMILTNGSVLVMGGEEGSNSAPTPSCEILPPPAGGYAKYLDWLDRTDPNNLYPFMYILPSGGIFVIYYNEARILDEGTFDTIKTLPNLPGSVNNFLAGRTYPLEGTAVMFPQYPPYTDPVTVLVCGGSSNGAAYAVDNCVSTQPEVASPTWTLERMPSQRVMSCICALPDGTYLILNGAQEGVAGFGLATDPNYNAVLYDPSKPVNQRMSIMATTIVARLYHSEAILMPDGRVMVSGSDPEDGTHPEEYRVEVFNPPYALNGLTAPSYTIATSQKDWSYGSTYTITANIPSGNLGSVRVSMMAAVSSTHGNSMGQRTLFLTVSCAGAASAATCTLTAPPTPHVAPPGWYQIFVLDGPTPGSAHWIRIGGSIADAAGIGKWPNYSDFNTPGLGSAVAQYGL